jgi:hypothetical protein
MSLEAKDINDGAILAATMQEAGANGSARFSIILPDGHRLCSEWIGEQNVRRARVAWLDQVKAAIEYRVKAKMREQSAPAVVVPAGTTAADLKPGPVTVVPNPAQDPLDYARAMYVQSRDEVHHMIQEKAKVFEALEKAQARLNQWEAIYTALSRASSSGVSNVPTE